jgi:teichuronic acid biosynthesis glycosyltransferase TuaC
VGAIGFPHSSRSTSVAFILLISNRLRLQTKYYDSVAPTVTEVLPENRDLRILTFTHLFPNVVQPIWGVFVYQRTAHLAKLSGNEITVVAPVPYVPKWFPGKTWEKYKQVPREEIVGDLRVVHPRYPHVPKIAMVLHGLLVFVGCYRCVLRLHRQRRFDCIDSHWVYPDGFAAALLAKTLDIPLFCSARGTDINVYPTFPLIRPLIRWSLQQAAGIIAVSRSLKKAIEELGIPGSNVQVIGNGVDLERFALIERDEARKRLNLPLSGKMIVAVGSLNEHKCHARLIAAFGEIAVRHTDARLYILGEGHLRKTLEAQVAEAGLANRVFLPGAQLNAELNWWYNAADLTCLSSSREGWPNVLLESLACGTPVVATNVGGIPEVLNSTDYGMLVEPEVAPLASGLDLALKRDWNREAMVCYSRSRTWKEVASELDAFLKDRISLKTEAR